MKADQPQTSWADTLTRWYHDLRVGTSDASPGYGLGAIVVQATWTSPDSAKELEVEYLSRQSVAEFLYDSVAGTSGNDAEQAVLFTCGVLDLIDYSQGRESLCFLVSTDHGSRPLKMFRVDRSDFGAAALAEQKANQN